MYVEEDGEAHAAHQHRQTLPPEGMHHPGAYRQAVQPGGDAPRRRCTQCNGEGRQQHLHDAVDTGVGIAVDDIPHGVGDEQPRHQDHQCADDRRGHGIHPPQTGRQICRSRHEEGGGDGAKEGVHLQPVQKPVDKTDDQPQQPRPQAVPQGAAKDKAEAEGPQIVAQIVHRQGVPPAGGLRLLQPLHRYLHLRGLPADAAAQSIELLHRIQIVAVEADALHDGQGLAVGGLEADGQAVGDGEHLTLDAVGTKNTPYGILHPKGLCAADGETVSHLCSQIRQKIIIHTAYSLLIGDSSPYTTAKNFTMNRAAMT